MNLQTQIVENLNNVVNNTTSSIKNLQTNINYVDNTVATNWVDYNLNILSNISNVGSYWDITYYERNGKIINYDYNYAIIQESKVIKNYLTITYDWYTPLGKTNIKHIIYTGARKQCGDSKDVYLSKKYGERNQVYDCRDTVINNNKIEEFGYFKESSNSVSIYNMVLQKRPHN